MDLQTIIELIVDRGGWGLSAIMMWAYWRKDQQVKQRDDQIFKLLQKQLNLLPSGGDEEE